MTEYSKNLQYFMQEFSLVTFGDYVIKMQHCLQDKKGDAMPLFSPI